ncbi:hypothetical protein B6N60_00128 [Richelia sinica FACHB-800]|uniref:Uncharacterized protein n=1 Tax=Richelia sinica FACHB-800 TaxID=1357546 RepID=A0A975T3K4_9NOST|nr:hypothetical protein B6N60_00128 [Richelia sinica FACHB-800]
MAIAANFGRENNFFQLLLRKKVFIVTAVFLCTASVLGNNLYFPWYCMFLT